MLSSSPKTLIAGYPAALANRDLRRGWLRARTLYARRQSKLNGTSPSRYVAAIKAVLTKLGYPSID